MATKTSKTEAFEVFQKGSHGPKPGDLYQKFRVTEAYRYRLKEVASASRMSVEQFIRQALAKAGVSEA